MKESDINKRPWRAATYHVDVMGVPDHQKEAIFLFAGDEFTGKQFGNIIVPVSMVPSLIKALRQSRARAIEVEWPAIYWGYQANGSGHNSVKRFHGTMKQAKAMVADTKKMEHIDFVVGPFGCTDYQEGRDLVTEALDALSKRKSSKKVINMKDKKHV